MVADSQIIVLILLHGKEVKGYLIGEMFKYSSQGIEIKSLLDIYL